MPVAHRVPPEPARRFPHPHPLSSPSPPTHPSTHLPTPPRPPPTSVPAFLASTYPSHRSGCFKILIYSLVELKHRLNTFSFSKIIFPLVELKIPRFPFHVYQKYRSHSQVVQGLIRRISRTVWHDLFVCFVVFAGNLAICGIVVSPKNPTNEF